MLGKTLSHYRVLEKLGAGGMGEVYLAEDTKLHRNVALKILPAELASDERRIRFEREAQAVAALNHPNIVHVYSVEETEGVHFITMERVKGKTLSELIPKKGMPLNKFFDIAIPLADAVSAAHEQGIIHRDLKPDNLMVGDDGRLKILDFGLAKLKPEFAEDGASELPTQSATAEGRILGTVAYMSPEQAEGKAVDNRSDIFSIGIILYEMATGERPFQGGTAASLLSSILRDTPQSASNLNPALPRDLGKIIRRCLVKDTEHRYQTAKDLRNELEELKREVDSGELAEGTPATAKRKRHIPAAVLAGALALLVIVAAGVWYMTQTGPIVPEKKSVAVLPFENLSNDPDQEYFSDGLTEDVITKLSKIPGLIVISRTSSMRYKDTVKTFREIGQELGVATLLEGAARKQGEQVRITAQLIDAQTDRHLWAESYDRQLSDIFAIQSDVAQKIASALRIELTPSSKARVEAVPTGNLTAYDYVLSGADYGRRENKQDDEHALELYKKAIELDPEYALAWAKLSIVYSSLVNKFGYPRIWLDSALEAAQKALSIDPYLAEGYASLDFYYFEKGQVAKALESSLSGLEFNPDDSILNYYVGYDYAALGRIDEGMPHLKKAVRLDPRTSAYYAGIGQFYMYMGENARAESWLTRALEIAPDSMGTRVTLGFLSLYTGNERQAREQVEAALSAYPDNGGGLILAGHLEETAGNLEGAKMHYQKAIGDSLLESARRPRIALGRVLLKEGQQDKARGLLKQVVEWTTEQVESGNERWIVHYDLAAAHAVLGDRKEAYERLNGAIDAGYRNYQRLQTDPSWEAFREEEQFKRIVADLKTMADEMRHRVEEMEKEWEKP